ncbi:Alpha/Beta hydrolase protein [Pterulicium gracile]|uniref:Alpha/Beta hydrolase protein n=1 Tax=Pterulicium gracile TaxID=1884261 RepID=A0A5C3Q776_9AGAR|nr:Alpha/Beta hydrolase protein [Pterula gracilis]
MVQSSSSRFSTIATGSLWLSLVSFVAAQGSVSGGFNWESIEPSTELQWVSCYDRPLQCARLSVPLDYKNPSLGTAAIAITRVPSPLAGTAAYRGPIIFNPGGPGGSGVEQTVALGGSWIGGIFPEQFDFIGFDPRGVRFSTPQIQIFQTDREMDQFNEQMGQGLAELSPESWDTLPQRLAILNDIGDLINTNFGDVLQHMTTENVARDMMAIVEASGFEKIQYYGVSYGTVLGATFATLFPDRVERMIIDAVSDIPGYYSNDWSQNVLDTDRTLLYVFEACNAAGARTCPFAESSIEQTQRRFDAILTDLEEKPFMLTPNLQFERSLFLSSIHNFLYSPTGYSSLIDLIIAVETRDVDTLVQALGGGAEANSVRKRGLPRMRAVPPKGYFEDLPGDLLELPGIADEASMETAATLAIRCTDGGEVKDTAEDLQEYARKTRGISQYFPDAADTVRIVCAGWKVHPETFRGPIGSQNTPLLVIGNTFDPITPIEAARNTVEAFPGSVLLTYDAPGHGSILSSCIRTQMNQYLISGELPAPGGVCNMTTPLFGSSLAPAPSSFDFEGLTDNSEAASGGGGRGGDGESAAVSVRSSGIVSSLLLAMAVAALM